jgi:PAS domain S-box-containing protein
MKAPGTRSRPQGAAVQTWLVVGFAAVIALLIGVATAAWSLLAKSQRSLESLYAENFREAGDLASLRSNFNAEGLAVATMLATPPADWGPWREDLQQRMRLDIEILDRLRAGIGNEPASRAELQALTGVCDTFARLVEKQVLPLLDAGERDRARQLFYSEGLGPQSQYRALARTLENRVSERAHGLVATARQRARAYVVGYVVIGSLAVLGTAVLCIILFRQTAGYLAERRRAETELLRANRALRAVNACNQVLVRATDEQELLRAICQAIVTEGGYRLVWVGMAEHDKARSIRPAAQAGFETGYVESLRLSWADNERGRGPTGRAIRTGRLAVCRDMATDPDFAPWRADAVKRGYASSMVLPLKSDGETFGALSIYAVEPDAFDAEEERLLTSLAEDLAFGMSSLRNREERRRFEQALHSASTYNRKLIEASPDPLVAIGSDGKITDVNAATEAATGRSRPELIGTDFSDYFTEPERARAGYKQVFREGAVRDYPLDLRGRDGRVTPVLYNASVYRDDRGNVAGVFAAARDVTERRRAEDEIRRINAELEQRVAERTAELAASERRFHGIYDTAPVSIWQQDWSEVIAAVDRLRADGVGDFAGHFRDHPDFVREALQGVRILDMNAYTLEMFGARDKEELRASLATVFRAPDTYAGFVGELIALTGGERVYRAEMALNRVDGTVTHGLKVMSFPAPGAGGQVLVSVTDITAQKSAEEALRRSEEQYRRLFDTTPQGVVYQDAAGKIISMNPAAVRILGKTPAEFLGSSSVEEEHGTIREDGSPFPGLEHPAMVALRTGRQLANVIMGVHNPCERAHRWISVQAVPLFRPGADAPYQVYTVFDDITERKGNEDRIRRLNEELQVRAGQLAVANKELEAFAYSVSHDLRAPLRSIDGFSRILLEEYRDRLDAEGRDALGRVCAATQRMDRLIDDLLTLSRVTRSEMRLQTVDMSRLAREVLHDLREREPDRTIEGKIAEGLSARADRNLMRVVLENLLGNAWKFTSGRTPASIEFGATERERPRVFFVRDNGAGFDMAYAGKLFGAFQRLHRADEFPGTGIGLATVQRILHRHGGRIWAEAAPEKGATFFFTLPV